MAPSFAAASFDVVVSCDVLEHVPDHRRALAAAARVLAPDGVLLLTVPFVHLQATTVVRAEPTADGVRHLLPPVRHHDPLRREGVLVFHDFGWDLLDDARAAGFASATVLLAGSLAHGYLGHPLHAFVFGKGAAGWPPVQRDHDAAPACR